MKNSGRLLIIFGLILLCACAPKIKPIGKNVRVVKNEPPGCKSIGEVYARSELGISAESNIQGARNSLRNKAGAKGANTVVIETYSQTGDTAIISGQALICPE